MTDDAWEGCCLLMEECFKGEFPVEKRGAYRVFLDDFTPEQVVAAMKVLAESGSPFLPAVPEIVQAIRRTQSPPVPAWSEAWHLIQRSLRCRSQLACHEFLAEHHPLLVEFVRREGWRELRQAPFFDEQYGPLRVKELQTRWEAFVGVAQEREALGLALSSGERRAGGLGRASWTDRFIGQGGQKALPEG